jgi:small-conductance mechanosensitive channel
VTGLWADRRFLEVLESLAIVLGSYVVARLASYLLTRTLLRLAGRSPGTVDDRLAAALQRPITYAVFLAGTWIAVHNLPVQPRWLERLDDLLFVVGVFLVSQALVRAWGILMGWYATESRHASRDGLAREFGPLFAKLGVLFIVVLAVITLLQHFGVNVASLVVSLGVGSLALGLAAQDTLSNMFAGFTLMADRPFRVGDRIRLASGEVGDVQEIGMRATVIRTLDETLLVVPNSTLVKERVVNLSQPNRSLTTRLEVGVAYGSDLSAVKRVLSDAALASRYTDRDRTPVVLVNRFADFFVNVLLIFWVRDYTEQGLGVSEVHEEIDRRFRQAGIQIPFPVRRVSLEASTPGVAREG